MAWRGFGMILEWFWGGSGLVLDWFRYVGDGCGLVLECFWNGCGIDFVCWEWFRIKNGNGFGVSVESFCVVVSGPCTIWNGVGSFRHAFGMKCFD